MIIHFKSWLKIILSWRWCHKFMGHGGRGKSGFYVADFLSFQEPFCLTASERVEMRSFLWSWWDQIVIWFLTSSRLFSWFSNDIWTGLFSLHSVILISDQIIILADVLFYFNTSGKKVVYEVTIYMIMTLNWVETSGFSLFPSPIFRVGALKKSTFTCAVSDFCWDREFKEESGF